MKIETPQDNKIIVELSAQDMSELDITYEEMDYSNIETRRVIWTILDRVRHALRRDIDPSSRMTIESVPTAEGGCVLFFTVPPQLPEGGMRQVLHIRRDAAYLLCLLDTPDALFRCAERLRDCVRPLPESRLFLWQSQYVLLLQSASRLCRMILAEYGAVCTENILPAAVLREHGKLLANENAIEKLTGGTR